MFKNLVEFIRSLEIKKDFSRKVLYDIFKFLILVIVAFLLANITSFINDKFEQFELCFFVLVFFVIILIWLVIYRRLNYFKPDFPRLEFDFQILDKEIVYKCKDGENIFYEKKNTIKALRNGREYYRDKYHWTGGIVSDFRSNIRGQNIRLICKKNIWQFYEISLQKVLKKSEIIDTHVIWELKDPEKKAVPFISATIEEPTRLLKLTLELPNSFINCDVTCETSVSIGARKPLNSEIKKIDRHGEVSWEIKNPKLLHHYEIKWNPN